MPTQLICVRVQVESSRVFEYSLNSWASSFISTPTSNRKGQATVSSVECYYFEMDFIAKEIL